MKIYLVFPLFVLLFLATASGAVDNKADLNIKTGDTELDLHLKSTNEKAATPAGMAETHKYLSDNYSLVGKEIEFLHKQGYTMGEIEYLAMLAKQSGQSVNRVAALHSQGVGWGVLAKRLGVRPSALRQLIVKNQKAERLENKPPKIEKTVVKEKIVIREQYRPVSPGGGGGHGGGKGRGR